MVDNGAFNEREREQASKQETEKVEGGEREKERGLRIFKPITFIVVDWCFSLCEVHQLQAQSLTATSAEQGFLEARIDHDEAGPQRAWQGLAG